MNAPGLAVLALTLGSYAAAQVSVSSIRIAPPNVFPNAVFLAQPPGETPRLYIVGQDGVIYILKDGVKLPTPFLDITSLVFGGSEMGLLGLAFHPQFQTNGAFFVYYTGAGSVPGVHIVRYTTNPANPEVADPSSAYPVLFISRLPGNHCAGWMGFGPDGYLYIASGNAGSGNNSGSLTTLLGKMLRLDIDHDDFPGDATANYAIPPTNPLAGSTTARPEIWAYGLRNPWRDSFDRQTGDLWIADVGDGHAGEINVQPAGISQLRHYGYPCMEGLACRANSADCVCNSPSLTLPIYDITSPGATIGGYVYRGSAIPGLQGTYFFGDYQSRFWSFRPAGANFTEFTDRTSSFAVPGITYSSSFGEDSSGELYICTLGAGIFKMIPECPANCDGSHTEPRLNVNDFQCFLNKFASGDSYANCDGSTLPPILTIHDFSCFMILYTAGCS